MRNALYILLGFTLWAAGVYCVLFMNLYIAGVVLVAGGVILLELFYYRVKDAS